MAMEMSWPLCVLIVLFSADAANSHKRSQGMIISFSPVTLLTSNYSSAYRDHRSVWMPCVSSSISCRPRRLSFCLLCLRRSRTLLCKWLCQQCQLYMEQHSGGSWCQLLDPWHEENLVLWEQHKTFQTYDVRYNETTLFLLPLYPCICSDILEFPRGDKNITVSEIWSG